MKLLALVFFIIIPVFSIIQVALFYFYFLSQKRKKESVNDVSEKKQGRKIALLFILFFISIAINAYLYWLGMNFLSEV
ncbi:hypothetical protein EMA8858_03828 [Emticicia aquatica]|uniref:Uncharacterized protein n=1 Tax=Emticicia aquatica TaxID=1681835 RepID=A0ABN8EYN5_9BACT|nr:hypothetical protein [Emticicia aquatica]CAH0997694.1 hypothetical protein EMA8858_03828 [Emticicia aquatica]